MKIAFIETKLHQRSQSSVFFKEILSKKHELLVMLDEPRSDSTGLKVEEINSYNCDAIIFWQFIKSPTVIVKIKCKNIIWIPMYDGEIVRKFKKIRLYGYTSLNLKIISFSKTQTDLFRKNGLNNILDIQYFPKIIENSTSIYNKNINILFWQRTEKINWNVVKKIIGENKINSLTIKTNFDGDNKADIYPNKIEKNKYNINTIDKWLEIDEYLKLLNSNDIFIEPREYEGIGMGFLDAMAHGVIVISPDKPTMNEYIEDGYNGYLYDLKNPKPIDFSNINKIKNNLKKYIKESYPKWKQNKEDILKFIKKTDIKKNSKLNIFYIIYGKPLEYLIITKRILTKTIKNYL